MIDLEHKYLSSSLRKFQFIALIDYQVKKSSLKMREDKDMPKFESNLVVAYVVDIKKERILMGRKKTDPGKGLLIGAGGHIEPKDNGDSIKAAQREVLEELGLLFEIRKIIKMGKFILEFKNKPDIRLALDAFIIDGGTEGAIETEEMSPVVISIHDLPFYYPVMLQGEEHWLKMAIWGIKSEGIIIREKPLGKLIKFDIKYL